MMCKAYVVVVLLLAFEALVKYHQIQCRPLQPHPLPAAGVIFPQVTRTDADTGLINCLKFFANYGFYRVGREVRCCSLFVYNLVSYYILMVLWASMTVLNCPHVDITTNPDATLVNSSSSSSSATNFLNKTSGQLQVSEFIVFLVPPRSKDPGG